LDSVITNNPSVEPRSNPGTSY